LVCGLLLLTGPAPLAAQPKSSPTGTLGVDVVRLKNGRSLRGALWQNPPDGKLVLVVRRGWLERAQPEWAAEAATENRAEQEAAWTDLVQRLEALLANPPEAPRLTFFLRQERERLQKLLDAPPDEPEFLWLQLDGKQVAHVVPAAPARQRIVLWAWHEHLADPETRDSAALQKELQKAGVKTEASAPDLSVRLPARPQTDREWTARLAVVEYALREPLDLQGTPDAVFPVKEGQRANLAAILPGVMERQLQSLLSDLTGGTPAWNKPLGKAWLPGAIRAAEEAGANGFRATRVEVVAEALRASVASEFVVQSSPGEWVTIWQTAESASGQQPRPEQEARIAADPQVKAAVDALRSLGLGAEEQVAAALRVGSATMAAQQAVDQRFFEFRDRYLKRLDGPPLTVPASQPVAGSK
jgi:hypothetical protein